MSLVNPDKASAMSKLHIRTAEQENPDTAFLESIVVTVLVCGVGLFGALQTFLLAKPERTGPSAAQLEAQGPIELRRTQELRSLDKDALEQRSWDQTDLLGALRYGPLPLANAACERWLVMRPSGSAPALDEPASAAIAAELASTLKRRVPFSPLSCALRAHLRGQLAATPALDAEAASVWAEAARLELPAEAMADAVHRWQVGRDRPDVPAFYEFLTLCAMRAMSKDAVACRDMLRQLSPAHGADLLTVVDRYLMRHVGELSADMMTYPVEALTTLAEVGQPPNLRVGGPEEDQRARKAAIFLLCRVAHHPDEAIAVAAGKGLSRVAGIEVSSVARYTRARWLDTCRLLFGGQRAPHEPGAPPNPTSEVATLTLDAQRPDPSLQALRAAGQCAAPEDAPLWDCVWSEPAWLLKGEDLSFELRKVYVETRHIEWGDAWFDAVEVWEIEKRRQAEEAAKQPAAPAPAAPELKIRPR
jgi:hypothetical protein